MSVCVDESANTNKFKKNNEKNNIMNRSCDKWRIKDLKNCSGSEDMFSDEDQLRNTTLNSPKVQTSVKNDTIESPSLLLKTPTLYSRVSDENSGRGAAVPKTPLGLVPLISKTDVLWTSDMETPETKKGGVDMSESCDKTKVIIDLNATPHHNLHSPTFEKTITEQKLDTTSPVLGGKKRPKKRAKRRLLNTGILDLDNLDQQSSVSSNSDRIPSDVASTVSNDEQVEPEDKHPTEANIENDVESNKVETEVKAVVTVPEKLANTSTQDFFSNASFSSIDNLCLKITKDDPHSTLDLENDNIEKRVAAIKRNQKIIRRSSDVNHTVVPKELFSKSVRDLELADAEFSQSKTKKVVDLPPKSTASFVPLSTLQNEEIENWFDDWNPDKNLESKISVKPVDSLMPASTSSDGFSTARGKNEKMNNFEKILSDMENEEPSDKQMRLQVEDGFSTGRGKSIRVSEDKENLFARIYNEIEVDEEEDAFLKIKKSNKQSGSKLSLKKPTDKVVLKFNTKASSSSRSDDKVDGFSTARGKSIKVSEAKESLYAKLYDELQDSNCDETSLLNLKNSKRGASNLSRPTDKATIKFKEEIPSNSKSSAPEVKKEAPEEIICNSEDFEDILECKPEFIKREPVILFPKTRVDCLKRNFRCRSFGGFEDGVGPAVKLNKSDPEDESVVNQPLQKHLSISQCFDPHSDSWLSKIEISHLDEKPKPKDEFLGFTSRETTESIRRHASMRKAVARVGAWRELSLRPGETATISNFTGSHQNVVLNFGADVNFERDEVNKYLLSKSVPEPEIKAEKRKHPDTDSDTPLTTLKKPRVGCDLQARKLFSDEDEESEGSHYDFGVKLDRIDDDGNLGYLAEERICALMKQAKIIKSKKSVKVKPILGTLLSDRLDNKEKKVSWSDLVDGAFPKPGTMDEIKKKHPDAKVVEVCASNALQYKFLSANRLGNKIVVRLDVGDGASLIFDENGHAGVSEFSEAFLAMPGVDPKLVPAGWVDNHYRWIVWKLASIDRMTFGSTRLPKVLLPDRVMRELKYRYDREIDRAQRSALRKILEKDDVPSRRLVLCISSIKETTAVDENDREVKSRLGLPRWKLEVSDGWYDIPVTIDSAMEGIVTSGKVKEGTKIVTYGAELLDCERGFHPLDKPSNVSLKIHTNCTRRARWDVKLGYQEISGPFPVKLKDIVACGGMIGEISAAVARLYPLLYREKTADGQSIYRNARSEEKAASAYERSLEKRVDAIYAEAEKNFDSRKKSDSDEDTQSTQGRENTKEKLKEKLESKVRQGLPPPRQVTPVLKCRLVDDKTTVILTIWGANDDSAFDIKEGDTITVYNGLSMGMRGGDLHVHANRGSHIKKVSLYKVAWPSRTCIPIPEIATVGFEPKFNEFDTVGVVVSSGPAPHGLKNFEVVNLAYPKSTESGGSSYLSILFWNGVSSFGYQNLFTSGSLVGCSNLEWRRSTSWSVPVAYCSEKSVFTCNPRQPYLLKELQKLKSLVQNPVTYAKSCKDDLEAELSKKPPSRSSSIGTPLGNSSSDSFYTPKNTSVQKRMEKLSRYGSTMDISPIVFHDSSIRVKKEFTPVTPVSKT